MHFSRFSDLERVAIYTIIWFASKLKSLGAKDLKSYPQIKTKLRHLSTPHRQNVCLHHYRLIHLDKTWPCPLTLWPWKPPQQCSLIRRIFLTSFIEIRRLHRRSQDFRHRGCTPFFPQTWWFLFSHRHQYTYYLSSLTTRTLPCPIKMLKKVDFSFSWNGCTYNLPL